MNIRNVSQNPLAEPHFSKTLTCPKPIYLKIHEPRYFFNLAFVFNSRAIFKTDNLKFKVAVIIEIARKKKKTTDVGEERLEVEETITELTNATVVYSRELESRSRYTHAYCTVYGSFPNYYSSPRYLSPCFPSLSKLPLLRISPLRKSLRLKGFPIVEGLGKVCADHRGFESLKRDETWFRTGYSPSKSCDWQIQTSQILRSTLAQMKVSIVNELLVGFRYVYATLNEVRTRRMHVV